MNNHRNVYKAYCLKNNKRGLKDNREGSEKRGKKRRQMKKCIYCGCELGDETVVEVCHNCGVGVWGEKCFKAIMDNMKQAEMRGDLYQGCVSNCDAPKLD